MIKTLSAGAIGVKVASLEDGIQKSKEFGFDGYEFDVRDVARRVSEVGSSAVKDLFAKSGIQPAVFGLPTDWRGEAEAWKQGVADLADFAKAAGAIGCTRTATWVMPCSNDKQFDEHWAFAIERFAPIAKVLGDSGISLGLEFIGPKTIRDTHRHDFVYKMGDMLKLAAEIGPNVGLLLDSYHWYASRGTLDEVRALKSSDVVYVHLNDAIAGVPIDELMDGTRLLPGESGAIDLKGFVEAVDAIGYDGPAAVEPFKKELNDLPSDADRLRVVSDSLSATLAK